MELKEQLRQELLSELQTRMIEAQLENVTISKDGRFAGGTLTYKEGDGSTTRIGFSRGGHHE